MTLPAIGILISGSGTNMVALVEAMQAGVVPAHPAIVISNNAQAAGLGKASALGVPTAVVDHRAYQGHREAFDAAVNAKLHAAGVDIVACAGFMRIMTSVLINAWAGRMLNIHPSLLPRFTGLNTHARALEAGVEEHGVTVHEVTQELDEGAILGQAVVPVLPDDTVETLGARVLRREHVLYPRALAAFIRDAEAIWRNQITILPDAQT